LDLGYSRDKASCGIMYGGLDQPKEVQFGNAICSVNQWISKNDPCILIVEAVLSTYHNGSGNPDIRGEFEKGRGWYHGAGVATFAAALRFLQVLRKKISPNASVFLAEAFLSFKKKRTRHADDALKIYNRFWNTNPEEVKRGTEPILGIIDGVPKICVFHE